MKARDFVSDAARDALQGLVDEGLAADADEAAAMLEDMGMDEDELLGLVGDD